jgi:ATP-binding cassette subfamily B (MDR/TAP) protein 1
MAICMSVSSFVVGFTYSWKLSLILLSVLPILLFCAFLLIQSIRTSDLRKFKAFEKAGGIAEEVLKNIKTVASFANFDYERKRFETKLEESYKSGIRGGMITALSVGFLFFTIFASYSLAIWFGSKLITEGDLNPSTNLPFSAGDVLTVLFTVVFGAMSLGQAAPNLKALSEAMSAAYDFFELMKRVPQIISQSGGSSPDKNSLKGRVEFHDVEFKYPSEIDEFVFKGLNIEIEENKITALVGPSGSGKTTIANLIERLYEISGGKILFDSYDITNLDLNYLRSLIGYVPQEPVLFNTSIRENIIFGRENVTDEMVWEACKQAMADEFIAMKEEGLDYIVGIKGSKLSGGQKQRIAIARAILTKPKILILDEATSALDNKSEKEVQLSLNKVMNGVTTVVIAHRLSTVMNADKIIVLKNGSVVNQGKHRELLDSCEVYNYLVKNQMGKTDLNDEDTNLILLKGKSDNLDLDNVEKEIPRARTQRKSSFQELEERILEEKNKKIQFEKSAANNRSRIIPILCQIKCVIIFAVFFTMIAGAVWPIYGVILADSISQLSNPDKSIVSEDGVKLAIYFLILAASAGVSSFFQK